MNTQKIEELTQQIDKAKKSLLSEMISKNPGMKKSIELGIERKESELQKLKSSGQQKIEKAKEADSTKELESEIESLESSSKSDVIKNNKILKKSLEDKLEKKKKELAEKKKAEPKAEAKKVEQPKKVIGMPKKAEPKVIVAKKEEKATSKKVVSAKKEEQHRKLKTPTSLKGKKIGDVVSFKDFKTGKTKTGTILRFEQRHGKDTFTARVQMKDKSTQKVSTNLFL